MDVVADARAIGRRVVRAIDLDDVAVPGRHFERERNQVRLRRVPLADRPQWIGTGSIEVAQYDRPQAVSTTGILQDTLDHELGRPIRVDRPLRVVLGDRYRL